MRCKIWLKNGGERGIRTLGTAFGSTHDFQSCSFSQLGHLSEFTRVIDHRRIGCSAAARATAAPIPKSDSQNYTPKPNCQGRTTQVGRRCRRLPRPLKGPVHAPGMRRFAVAEEQGFEPWKRVNVYCFSRAAPSATRPLFRFTHAQPGVFIDLTSRLRLFHQGRIHGPGNAVLLFPDLDEDHYNGIGLLVNTSAGCFRS